LDLAAVVEQVDEDGRLFAVEGRRGRKGQVQRLGLRELQAHLLRLHLHAGDGSLFAAAASGGERSGGKRDRRKGFFYFHGWRHASFGGGRLSRRALTSPALLSRPPPSRPHRERRENSKRNRS